jgi:hypothetical protein
VVNFLPSFALPAIIKDHNLDLNFHFVNTEKYKRMVVVRGNNPDSACMKNDRTQSQDSAVDNATCDSRMIRRELGGGQRLFGHLITKAVDRVCRCHGSGDFRRVQNALLSHGMADSHFQGGSIT